LIFFYIAEELLRKKWTAPTLLIRKKGKSDCQICLLYYSIRLGKLDYNLAKF